MLSWSGRRQRTIALGLVPFGGKVALFTFFKEGFRNVFLEKVLFHLGLCEMLGTISLGPRMQLEGPYWLQDWQSGNS